MRFETAASRLTPASCSCLEATALLRTAALSIALSLTVHAALVEAGTDDCVQRGGARGVSGR